MLLRPLLLIAAITILGCTKTDKPPVASNTTSTTIFSTSVFPMPASTLSQHPPIRLAPALPATTGNNSNQLNKLLN
jgi:hypothetical protein